ncbi:MAG TPA: toxin [Bacillaceae bacterium]
MRKLMIIPMVMAAVLSLGGLSKATYEGQPLEFSSLYAKLPLDNNRLLGSFIILPESGFDEKDASDVIKRLDHLPVSILKEIVNQHIKLVLFQGKLTDQGSASHLKGIIPRGHPASSVWDEVPGIGGSKIVLVKIGSSDKGNGHGSINLELHELVHSLQHYVYQQEGISTEFKAAWLKEAAKLFPDREYLLSYPEEYFAETFAYYYFSDETRELLRKMAPDTYRYFSRFEQ